MTHLTVLEESDLAPTILAWVGEMRTDGRLARLSRLEASVRGAASLEPLLALEIALRDAGLGGGRCELIWACERGASEVEMRLTAFDAQRHALARREVRLARSAQSTPATP